MHDTRSHPAGGKAIRDQLERVLRSSIFKQAERQRRFLTYVVEQELAGRGERLSQYAIAADVFDRDTSFDPLVDSIVRVEARRLRSKLAEYYAGNGGDDPIVIALPKGRYRIAVRAVEAGTGPAASSRAPDPPERPSIAVLPFDNLSVDPEQEYFSDGISEDLITDLSKLSGLTVLSRHSTFVYKGRSVTCREIADDLGARYVLEGSVRKAGDRLRISAQLIDAASDRHLWAERYDRELGDVFAVQDDVTRRIVDALRLRLTGPESRRLGRRATASTEAHDLYLRAQEQFHRFTTASVDRADALLTEAITVDPRYADAHAWRSRVRVFSFVAGIRPSRVATIGPAIAGARRAVSLDERAPLGHAALGWALVWDRQVDEAIAEVSHALELAPSFADGFLWHSLALASAGRGRDALASIRRGVELNPHYTVTYLFAFGAAYFALGDYAEARIHFDRGIKRSPRFVFNHLLKAAVLGLTGPPEETVAARDRLAELPHSEHVVREAFFFNDPALAASFNKGLKLAGL